MKHFHLAHLQSFTAGVPVGTEVERGQLIGYVGKTGTRYAHCHVEGTYEKPKSWTQYPKTLSKEKILELYFDVTPYIDKRHDIPARYDTYGGYEFLDEILDKNGKHEGYHLGVDINSGHGDDDIGNPVVSLVNGKVVYIGRLEGGWGNHIWIEETEGHWSDEAMNWNVQHHILGEKRDPNSIPTWGELVVMNKRLAEKIIEWTKT